MEARALLGGKKATAATAEMGRRVRPSSQRGGLAQGDGPSVGGQRVRQNNFTVEGVDNNPTTKIVIDKNQPLLILRATIIAISRACS